MAAKDFEISGSLLQSEHYVAIGMVASNWAAFEYLVNSALWYLAKVDDEPGACLTSQIPNMGRSFDALAAIVRLRGGTDTAIRKINQFAQETHTLGTKRNRVVHDPWAAEKKTSVPHRLEISAQKKLIFGYQPVPTAQLQKVVEEIAAHMDQFDKLMKIILAEIGPSLEKPLSPSR
jgi:hypothetical protein